MQDHEIEILEATLKDAEEIIKVQQVVWLDTYPNKEIGITYKDVEEQTKQFNTERLIKKLSDPGRHYWIAKTEGNIIGILTVSKGEEINTLQALYILPEFQGKGVGSKLIKNGLEWLGTKKNVVLGVASYNKNAIEFYKKFGFVENGERHDEIAILSSGKVIPEVEMILPSI